MKRYPKKQNPVYLADLKTGDESEEWFEEWLQEGFIDRDWEISKGRNWRQIDYKSVAEEGKPTIFIELKSRNIEVSDHYSTMLGANKLTSARKKMKKGGKVYFFFLFRGLSGNKRELYFYNANRCLNKLEQGCEIRIGGTTKRGLPEYKDHLYIPIKFLTNIKDFKNMNNYFKSLKN